VSTRPDGIRPGDQDSELQAWAQTTACCPECQVTPTVPCHLAGRPLPDGRIHNRRYQEAKATAA
jgi:hypothetical protein